MDSDADGLGNACDPVPIQGDVTGDCRVNIFDLSTVAIAFGSTPGSPDWNENADTNKDGMINVFDMATVGMSFGNSC